MTPAHSASVRMFESVRALTAEDNLSTATRRTWRSSLCSPAHGAAAVIFDFAAPGTPIRWPRLGTILRTVNVDAAREVGVAPGRPQVVEVNWIAGWAPGRSTVQRSCSARMNRKRFWIV